MENKTNNTKLTISTKLARAYEALSTISVSGIENIKKMTGVYMVLEEVIGELTNGIDCSKPVNSQKKE